jgi:guanosine-3',5'-bis(diphosphate) 3'-pyrophosphohydrolase
MNSVRTIMRAAEFAAVKHSNQRRAGKDAEPYINHLIEVASLVADATDGNPDAVIAALLHDVVEDQDVTNAEVAQQFGSSVAAIVAEVTDDKTLSKEERKHRQVTSAPHKSEFASLIKLADKTANLRAIANSPPPWPSERKREYVAWAQSVVSALPVKPAPLLAKFEAAARSALASVSG